MWNNIHYQAKGDYTAWMHSAHHDVTQYGRSTHSDGKTVLEAAQYHNVRMVNPKSRGSWILPSRRHAQYTKILERRRPGKLMKWTAAKVSVHLIGIANDRRSLTPCVYVEKMGVLFQVLFIHAINLEGSYGAFFVLYRTSMLGIP